VDNKGCNQDVHVKLYMIEQKTDCKQQDKIDNEAVLDKDANYGRINARMYTSDTRHTFRTARGGGDDDEVGGRVTGECRWYVG